MNALEIFIIIVILVLLVVGIFIFTRPSFDKPKDIQEAREHMDADADETELRSFPTREEQSQEPDTSDDALEVSSMESVETDDVVVSEGPVGDPEVVTDGDEREQGMEGKA